MKVVYCANIAIQQIKDHNKFIDGDTQTANVTVQASRTVFRLLDPSE